jgi:hypothetical protein
VNPFPKANIANRIGRQTRFMTRAASFEGGAIFGRAPLDFNVGSPYKIRELANSFGTIKITTTGQTNLQGEPRRAAKRSDLKTGAFGLPAFALAFSSKAFEVFFKIMHSENNAYASRAALTGAWYQATF